jgi:hypothetical protein
LQSTSIPGSKRLDEHCKALQFLDQSAWMNIAKHFNFQVKALRLSVFARSNGVYNNIIAKVQVRLFGDPTPAARKYLYA